MTTTNPATSPAITPQAKPAISGAYTGQYCAMPGQGRTTIHSPYVPDDTIWESRILRARRPESRSSTTRTWVSNGRIDSA